MAMALAFITVHQTRSQTVGPNGWIVPAESKTFLPSVDLATRCPGLRIAVINGVSSVHQGQQALFEFGTG